MVRMGQKLKMPKRCEKPFYRNIRFVLCKKLLQKTPTIREMRQFSKSAICKGYSPCKGYSLCKMVNLGQKLKIPKTCEKPFFKNITFVLCKKNTKYLRTKTILKIAHLEKAIAQAKAIGFVKFSVWVKSEKYQEHAKNRSTRTLDLFCAKSRSKKHQMFEK